MNPAANSPNATSKTGYNRLLLCVAGLGGLLFGIDVGIISGALPYLEATSGLNSNQLSFVAAAVLLGGIFSMLFAGALADWLGRRTMMLVSGGLFVVSVPAIALSHSYEALVLGRLLQGMSGGLIGVVVPLYLAECLSAFQRGKGTAFFQWLLTLGFVAAAFTGFYFSGRVEAVARLGDAQKLFAFKDSAWRGIFWVSLPPGILFVLGGLLVSESPRWLFRRGKTEAARRALLRSRTDNQAEIELQEMKETAAAENSRAGAHAANSLLQRKYLIPFALACVILACNQATGVNSIIIYNTTIFLQSGFGDKAAHLCNLGFTITNFLATIGAIALVDRKGRKFLLSAGTASVVVSLLATGMLFRQNEAQRVDVKDAVQATVIASNQTAVIEFNEATSAKLLSTADKVISGPKTLVVIYAYGDFRAASKVVRSDEPGATLTLKRENCLPTTRVSALYNSPFADLEKSRAAPLKIEHAILTPVPSLRHAWLAAIFIYCFMASFAIGPGVCVWLALSELMPTRIRSNGMSLALFLNHCVSTTIAALFLPTVGRHGYSTMFFLFAGCTVVYFVTATFFLPETKGKTLEEIEELFEPGRR